MMNKIIFYVVNDDWFFISHRLPLGLEMQKRGYQVYILAKDSGRFEELNTLGLKTINIDFDRSGKNPKRELSTILKLRKIYKKYKPDIIHHVTIKPVIYGSIAAKATPKSIIVNAISGLGYAFTTERKNFTQKAVLALMRFAYKGNVNFIFQNPDDLLLYRNLGYAKGGNWKLIKGAGVDSSVFDYTLPIKKPVLEILFLARILKDKGVLEFIGAAKILKDKWKNKAKFILLGDIDLGNPSALTEEELNQFLETDYLVWHGHSKDVRPNLINSDIVCLPSYREGLPKALIEGMAIGRPIVSTDVPGCRECVDNNVNGILVEPRNSKALAEAIESLLERHDLRLAMGEASRDKMMRELSLDKVIKETTDFYTYLVNESSTIT